MYLSGTWGLAGWQYLFLFEGIPTVLVSLVSFLFLFDHVDEVSWLTAEQKELQRERIPKQPETSITWNTIWTVFSDWKVWTFGLVYLLTSVNMTSAVIFFPVIIHGKKAADCKTHRVFLVSFFLFSKRVWVFERNFPVTDRSSWNMGWHHDIDGWVCG